MKTGYTSINAMNTKVISYCRVSTENQKERDTVTIQRESIADYCREKGLQLVNTFVDEGISGSKELAERKGLSELFNFLENNNEVKTVIIWKLDRLARSVYVSEMLLHKFSGIGVTVISIAEGDLNNESDPFRKSFRQFLSIFAELERDFITMRLSSGREKKAKAGGYSGGKIPYGYAMDKESGELVINESEAVNVRKMFELFRGGFSFRAIASEMEKQGIKTRSGKTKWNHDTINGIIKNQIYSGYYSYNGNVTFQESLKIA